MSAGKLNSTQSMARLRWVRQDHAEGCALAMLAMVTGESYDTVRTEIDGWDSTGHDGDWHAHGVSHVTADRYLIARGFYLQRIYKIWGLCAWPPAPWAPLHFASVNQPNGHAHFVVMDAEGRVLDPLREGIYSLTDWPEVSNVVGLKR